MAATSNQKGFLLLSTLFILTIMIIIVSFYLSAILQEVKIANILKVSPQTYYLAEAGVQEAFWKLQNDSSWKTNFETDPNWSVTFTRNNALVSGSSYAVAVENRARADASITATSTISIRDIESERVVKVGVYKALSDTPVNGATIITNGAIRSTGSNVNIVGGDLRSNSDIELDFFSNWSTDHNVYAAGEVDVDVDSTFTAANIYDENRPPVPDTLLLPEIDFDSSDPSSYLSRADAVYSANAFKQLLDDFPVTTLNGITYVTGNIYIKRGATLTVNGTLVTDGTINIGSGQGGSGTATLTINQPAGGGPSGLLGKKNVTFGGFNAAIDIAGLVYAGSGLRIQDSASQNVSVAIEGGIIAQNIDVLVSWNTITITHNQTYINDTLGLPVYSPLLFISHWEESY